MTTINPMIPRKNPQQKLPPVERFFWCPMSAETAPHTNPQKSTRIKNSMRGMI